MSFIQSLIKCRCLALHRAVLDDQLLSSQDLGFGVGKVSRLAHLEDGRVVIAVLEDNETVNLKCELLKNFYCPWSVWISLDCIT
jgi:hypothetical protein